MIRHLMAQSFKDKRYVVQDTYVHNVAPLDVAAIVRAGASLFKYGAVFAVVLFVGAVLWSLVTALGGLLPVLVVGVLVGLAYVQGKRSGAR